MPEYVGGAEHGILIPEPVTVDPFPITPDYGTSVSIEQRVAVHRFGSRNAKTEQRFLLGPNVRKFQVKAAELTRFEYESLRDWWEDAQGPYAQFIYEHPAQDGSTESVLCRIAEQEIAFEHLVGELVSCGLTLVEIPGSSYSSSISATVTRFPSVGLASALLSQTQEIIPLLKIVSVDQDLDPIYVSDRRCTIGGQLYQPRLLDWSGIQQTLGENQDQAAFKLGNADRVWRDLVNVAPLVRATVEFSLFHVGSTTKIDLWAGHCSTWAGASTAEFELRASDGAYEMTLAHPARKVARTCWKKQGDGIYCDGNPETPCGKSWDGCNAPSKLQFGGIVAPQQAVRIKDNSTGVHGFGRSSLTSVSIRSDSIYERVLQEVYTDIDMPVTCDVAAGRDESEFYSAMGIVGEGPIGGFSSDLTLHLLDSQPPHDPQKGGGWRYAQGFDPALTQDYFGISQAPWSGPAGFPGATYAAGTCFAEIRRTDAKGLQLSKISDRQMQVTVTAGLGRWTWTAPGSRVWVSACVNPVWVAVNLYLRACGAWVDYTRSADLTSAEMEAYFDVPAAIAAAAICDTTVDKIIGEGTEPQFQFRGVIREEKSVRNWLQEILNCCLGYYTFAFGKLKIGIRSNSSAAEAFSDGNILLSSLSLSPVVPKFNHLTGQFGDQEYGWALISVVLYDEDHANLYGAGRAQFLKSNMSFVGVSTKSQASRIVTARLREELGGVNESEWMAARSVSFKTTVLALNVDPGKVCSMGHADMPGGTGEFRVISWKLNRDFSIELEGQTTTDSMYDMTAGPKPADVEPAPAPAEVFPEPTGPVWMPHASAAANDDPVTAGTGWTFDIQQIADGSAFRSEFAVRGELPVTSTVSGSTAPTLRSISVADSGGGIGGGKVLYICVAARTASGKVSPRSNVVRVALDSSSDHWSVAIGSARWPAGTWAGHNVYAGYDERTMCLQSQETGTLLDSIDFPGPVAYNTVAPPLASVSKIRIAARVVARGGLKTMAAVSVSGGNQIRFAELEGSLATLTGLILSQITDASDGSSAGRNFQITGFSSSTGTVTVSPGFSGLDAPAAGDVFTLRAAVSVASATTVTAGWAALDGVGLTVNADRGLLLRTIHGTGKGQIRLVTSNTSTQHTVDKAWDVEPDETTIFVLESPGRLLVVDSDEISTETAGNQVEIRLDASNLQTATLGISGLLVDKSGVETLEEMAPFREARAVAVAADAQLPPETIQVSSNTTLEAKAQTVEADASDDPLTITLPPAADWIGLDIAIIKVDDSENPVEWQCSDGDMQLGNSSGVIVDPGACKIFRATE